MISPARKLVIQHASSISNWHARTIFILHAEGGQGCAENGKSRPGSDNAGPRSENADPDAIMQVLGSNSAGS